MRWLAIASLVLIPVTSVFAGDPPLQRLLSDDAKVRAAAAKELVAGGDGKAAAEQLSSTLKGTNPAKRIAAARALAALGPAAAPATGALLQQMTLPDATLRAQCIDALGAIGPEALGEAKNPLARLVLKPTMGSTETNERAYRALERMGDKPRAHLLRALKSPDARRRALGATLLGKLKDKEAVGALSRALKDKDWFCRWKAAEALGRLGKLADRAAPSLARLLRDRKAPVRRATATALGAIGNERAVPDLAKAVARPDDYVARDAAHALERFGRRAAPAVEVLTQALSRKPLVAEAAADALGRIGSAAATAAPALAKALGQGAGLRERAARALGRIGAPAKAAVPALVAALEKGEWAGLRSKTEWGGVFATWALSRMGAAAEPALSVLTTLTQSKDGRINKAASLALARIQKAVADAKPKDDR